MSNLAPETVVVTSADAEWLAFSPGVNTVPQNKITISIRTPVIALEAGQTLSFSVVAYDKKGSVVAVPYPAGVTVNNPVLGTASVAPNGLNGLFVSSGVLGMLVLTPTCGQDHNVTVETASIDIVADVLPLSAPFNVQAVAGDAQASVSFAPPINTGGELVVGYDIYSTPAGGVDSAPGSTDLARPVTGLANGVTYTFTVVASTTSDVSPPSNPSNPVMPQAVDPVPPASVLGDLTTALAFDSFEMLGVALVLGTAVLVNSDSLSASGSWPVGGAAAITEVADGFAATGHGPGVGDGVAVLLEAADTLSAGASARATAILIRTEVADAVVATAGAFATGNTTATETADNLTGLGYSANIGGVANVTEAANTVSASGTAVGGGVAGVNEAADSASGAGVTSGRVGTATIIEAANTLSATGSAFSTGGLTVYPSTYTIPGMRELQFSDITDPNNLYSTGAVGKYQDQIYGQGVEPGRYYSNGNADIPWVNMNGDWIDAAGQPQGSTPFAQVAVADLGSLVGQWVEIDATALMKLWAGGTKNYGFFLRRIAGTGVIKLRTRHWTTASERPHVIVQTVSQGAVTIWCERTIWIESSSFITQGGKTDMSVADSNSLAWADASTLTPSDITSATLRLWSFDQIGPATIGVFRVSNPADQSTLGAQKLGIAAQYDRDQGIENHPDVLFVQKFADANWDNLWIHSTTGSGGTRITAADGNGFTPLCSMYAGMKCSMFAGGPQLLSQSYWSPWRGGGLRLKPNQACERLYLRYFLMWGFDWDSMPDGGKMPGFDGRYSTLQSLVYLAVPGMGRGNSGSGCDGFTGYSVRGNYDRKPTVGAPLDQYRSLGQADMYHPDQTGDYGSNARWDRHYLAHLRKGEWNCIDVEIILNDVTYPDEMPRHIQSIVGDGAGTATVVLMQPETSPLYRSGERWSIGGIESNSPGVQQYKEYNRTAPITVVNSTTFTYPIPVTATTNPTTSYHNEWQWLVCCPGEGIKNGVIRGWVNGYLAGEHTGYRWRHSRYVTDGSTIFGIDAAWIVVYEGGNQYPQSNSSCYIANVVIAKSYIGPMGIAPSLPTWLASKAVNEWVSIPNTALDSQNWTEAQAAGLTDATNTDTGFGFPGRGILAYSGGTRRTSGSELLLFGGGGAFAWGGNDIRSLRLEDNTPVWRTRRTPSAAANVPLNSKHNTTGPGGQTPDPSTPYMKDGLPNSRHSYWQPQFHDARDEFYAFGCVNTWEQDSGQFYNVDRLNWGTNTWASQGAVPNCPHARGQDGNWIVKHPSTEKIYVSGASFIDEYDPATNAWTQRFSTVSTALDRGGAAIDPVNNKLLRVGLWNSVQNVPLCFDMSTTPFGMTVATFTGPYASAIDFVNLYWANGFVYDTALGCFLMYQDDGYVYTITRMDDATWAVNRLVTTGTPPAVNEGSSGGYHSIWGRMQYMPNLHGIALVLAGNKNAYFMRTSADGSATSVHYLYVATTGSDSNAGTLAAPYATLEKAHSVAVPGDTILMRGGMYVLSDAGIVLTRSGTSVNPITIANYTNEVPILDGASMVTSNRSGIEIQGSYWHLKGLIIKNAPFCGVLLTGTAHDNVIEMCELDHCTRINGSGAGIQIASTCGANNVLLNNDSHHNGVIGSTGGDGIGNSTTATGTIIRGNRCWRNNDDGIDLWGAQKALVENNWVWENGKKDDLTPSGGNGMGFKLGGSASPNGLHTIRNNLSWRNQEHGFTDNSATLTMNVFNNTAWSNGNRNYAFYTEVAYVLKNNLGHPQTLNYLPDSLLVQQNNAWQLAVTVNDADFQSLDYSGATSARGADGSLPVLPFLKLVAGSDLINKGVDVGIAFTGSAPDLGAYET